jgi:hypothetical protein
LSVVLYFMEKPNLFEVLKKKKEPGR